jgi:hypothetical protein
MAGASDRIEASVRHGMKRLREVRAWPCRMFMVSIVDVTLPGTPGLF